MKSVLIFVVAISAISAELWDSYVDENLVGAGLKSAAIIGLDGSVLANNNVEPTTAETKKIVEQFNDPEDVFANGIKFGGVKYMGIKGDPGSLYGKLRSGGIIVVKTTQVVLVGIYDENLNPQPAAQIVEKLGDYLRDSGN